MALSTSLTDRVADPGCWSRILIFVHPGSRIQKQQQKNCCPTSFL
jgi:hypothetical protein